MVFVGLILMLGLWQIVTLIMEYHPIKNYPAKGTHIVVLGDSLSVGIGTSRPERGFVPMLSARLGVPIVNKGVSGDGTRDAKLRLEKDVLAENPDMVIILLGGNDNLKKIPREETFENLRTMITEIQSRGSIVVLLGVRGGFLTDHFANDFASLAKETGSLYIPDVLEGIIGNPALLSDEVHPNDRGYEKMVDKVAPSVLGLLPE